MSVADILQQMAENAGRARLQRGAILGDVIAEAAKVPAGILDARDQQRQIDAQRARQQAQDARQAGADARAVKADADAQHQQDLAHQIITAYTAGTPNDPSTNNLDAGIAKARELGAPEFIDKLREMHRKEIADAQPKPVILKDGETAFDPVTRAPIPGMTVAPKPVAPTVASLDAEQQRILSKPEADRTPAEVASARAYTERRAPTSVPTIGSLGDYLTRYAREQGKDPAALTTAEIAKVTKQHTDATQKAPTGSNNPGPVGAPPSKAEIAMANYMVPTPSPRTFATPAGKAMMDRILTVNPEFDASMYSVRAPTRKAFTTGTQGQQLTAMNTAVEHLDQLQRAADALDNGTLVPGNALMQSLKETFGSNAPTNYETIKNMVDKEVEAVANKGVPTVSGTAEQKALAGKKAAPGQIQGYINTLIPLMGSKVNALHYQYKQAMGANDPFDPLTPEAKAILVKRGFDPSATRSSTAAGGSLISVTDPTGGVHQFPTQAAADAFKKAAGIQ